MQETYVAAAQKAIHEGIAPTSLIAGLRRVMEQRGHEQLLVPVLRGVLREQTATRARRTIVRVANARAFTEYEAAITATLTNVNANEPTIHEVDSTLIGGYQVEANYQRVDASYKHTLLNLYRAITTS